MKRLLATFCILFAAALLAPAAVPARPQERAEARVVLVSIDGFAAFYWDDPRVRIPHLRRLAAQGARAEAMTVSTPSVTWPNHTTLVTGVSPRGHGVLTNGVIERSDGPRLAAVSNQASRAALTNAETIYDRAHAAGLITAEINWPVTREAATLHWSYPDTPAASRWATPSLLEALRGAGLLGGPDAPSDFDVFRTQAAILSLRELRPHLLLLHLLRTDGAQHSHGPRSPEAYVALEEADARLGEFMAALAERGVAAETTVIVTADHGFERVTRIIHPNAALREAGLIREIEGTPHYDVQSLGIGGVAAVYARPGPEQEARLARAREALAGIPEVVRVWGPEAYPDLGLPDPAANEQSPDLLLSAADGHSFGNDTEGELIREVTPRGVHGYVHTNPKMDALFLAWGRGIRPGAALERVDNRDVAPTIARLLGLTLPAAEGEPLEEILLNRGAAEAAEKKQGG